MVFYLHKPSAANRFKIKFAFAPADQTDIAHGHHASYMRRRASERKHAVDGDFPPVLPQDGQRSHFPRFFEPHVHPDIALFISHALSLRIFHPSIPAVAFGHCLVNETRLSNSMLADNSAHLRRKGRPQSGRHEISLWDDARARRRKRRRRCPRRDGCRRP